MYSMWRNSKVQRIFGICNLIIDIGMGPVGLAQLAKLPMAEMTVLDLSLNIITLDGKGSLALSVIDISCLNSDSNSTSLNAVSESNHTCLVKFTDEEDVLSLGQFNRYADPVSNKNIKLFSVLQRYHLKEDTPLQIIPKVLALLHNVARNQLDALFGFMKEWNMPLLYTSRLGKDPRRSKRIRKKMVNKCMGKK